MSFTSARTESRRSRLNAWIASAAALLLVILSVAVASPSVHRWLHGHDVADHDDGCAVVLLATGVTLAAGAIALRAPRETCAPQAILATCDAAFRLPAFLHLPERAPPQL